MRRDLRGHKPVKLLVLDLIDGLNEQIESSPPYIPISATLTVSLRAVRDQPVSRLARRIDRHSGFKSSLEGPETPPTIARDFFSGEKATRKTDHEYQNDPEDQKIVHRNIFVTIGRD